jgi:hypothetical protein
MPSSVRKWLVPCITDLTGPRYRLSRCCNPSKLSIQIRTIFQFKPLKREQSSNLLLAFASTVIRGFGTHDHIFCPFQYNLRVLKWGLLFDERVWLILPTACQSFKRWVTAKLLLALSSTVIPGSESHGTHDHVLVSDGSGSLQTILLVLKAEFLLNDIGL